MPERLTSRMVRRLRQRQAEQTSLCPECGGERWGDGETLRICTGCGYYLICVGGYSEIYDENDSRA